MYSPGNVDSCDIFFFYLKRIIWTCIFVHFQLILQGSLDEKKSFDVRVFSCSLVLCLQHKHVIIRDYINMNNSLDFRGL